MYVLQQANCLYRNSSIAEIEYPQLKRWIPVLGYSCQRDDSLNGLSLLNTQVNPSACLDIGLAHKAHT